MILILSNKWDVSIDFVIKELRARKHPFLRINTEDFINNKATISLPDFHVSITKGSQTYDLTENVRVIWNRRPGKVFDDIPKESRPTQAVQKYVNDQWYSWLEALQLINNVTWINHPQANDAMENKIRQLRLAKELGFNIPNTIFSNDPSAANDFLDQHDGRLIAKALYSPLIEEDSQDSFIFSNLITELPVSHAEIRMCPSIFQEPIVPKVDYRVTVIGNTVIAAKIHGVDSCSIPIDWRTKKDGVTFSECKLPANIEELCRLYVKKSGLLFGAIDLLEYNNNFTFLEINPNGEWGWLQKPAGLPIAEALCDLMAELDG